MTTFCSSCGSTVAQGASFCNRCGARTSAVASNEPARPSEPNPESLVWALVATVLGGLALMMGFLAILKKELEFTNDLILLFAFVWVTLIVAASGAIFWVLVRGRRAAAPPREPAQLAAPGPAALAPPPASVTDATTRQLEPAAPKSYDTPRSI